MNQATDKFGEPIYNGDYVLCKFHSYGGSSELAIGKIDKVCITRHQVRKCDDQGNVLMDRFRNFPPSPQRMKYIDKYNMVKIKTKGDSFELMKTMTL